MTRLRRGWLAIALVLVATGCGDTYIDVNNPLQPSSIGGATNTDVVEFRVDGDVPLVTVRVNNGLDGLAQTTSVLPFTQRLPLLDRESVFLSIDARATGFGFLHVAIFVNGVIFREASSETLSPYVTVNGTYRRK